MPHGSNKIFTHSFPNVTHKTADGITERFIGEISDGTLIRFRYFSGNARSIGISYRGEGCGKVTINGKSADIVSASEWTDITVPAENCSGRFDVTITYAGKGNIEIKDLFFV